MSRALPKPQHFLDLNLASDLQNHYSKSNRKGYPLAEFKKAFSLLLF